MLKDGVLRQAQHSHILSQHPEPVEFLGIFSTSFSEATRQINLGNDRFQGDAGIVDKINSGGEIKHALFIRYHTGV